MTMRWRDGACVSAVCADGISTVIEGGTCTRCDRTLTGALDRLRVQ